MHTYIFTQIFLTIRDAHKERDTVVFLKIVALYSTRAYIDSITVTLVARKVNNLSFLSSSYTISCILAPCFSNALKIRSRIYAIEMSRSKNFVNPTDKYLTRKYTLNGNYVGYA